MTERYDGEWTDEQLLNFAKAGGYNMGHIWLPMLRGFANALLAAQAIPADPNAKMLSMRPTTEIIATMVQYGMTEKQAREAYAVVMCSVPNATPADYNNYPGLVRGEKVYAKDRATEQATPADQGPALESMTRMFHEACAALGLINEALGLDPDDGGAEPILDAIAALKAERDQWVDAQYVESGECESCEDGMCVTGSKCVTLGRDATPADHSVPVAIYQVRAKGDDKWSDVLEGVFDSCHRLHPDKYDTRIVRESTGEPVGKIVSFGKDLKEVSWHKGKMPPEGTKLYAQPPQPEAQSVRDAWISLDERLPEQHEWVLVSDGTWSAIGMHLDDEDLEPNKRWMDESAELIESNGIKITHWQPLPAPPQKPVEVKP